MEKVLTYFLFCLIAVAHLFSCKKGRDRVATYHADLLELPQGFPAMEFPEDNQFSVARWELGKRLFYDPILSSDQSISCSSCHQASLGFSDDKSFSFGVDDRLGTRNSPSLANIGYHPYFTREGGVTTLEMQVLVPIQEHNEFDYNIVLIAERMNADTTYISMSLEAYDRIPDAYVITRSIATFERSLISGYSPYDQFKSYGSYTSMTASQLRGMDLFFSDKTQCSSCHEGFNFTNYSFENNGLYEEYTDPGRFRFTGMEADRALFKTPSLRNVALTAPYMHDGSLNTLASVVAHYNSGGKNHPHKSDKIHPLHLTSAEQVDLVNFLKSLTDETFVNNELFK